MAKITAYIPEPQEEYKVENQRQVLEALDTVKTQLNFSFQQDMKNEQDAFNYFLSWVYNIKINATVQGLNLEAGDAIKVQAAEANQLNVVCNYALINRENENGWYN